MNRGLSSERNLYTLKTLKSSEFSLKFLSILPVFSLGSLPFLPPFSVTFPLFFSSSHMLADNSQNLVSFGEHRGGDSISDPILESSLREVASTSYDILESCSS